MNKPWENETCDDVMSYFSIYPVYYAAALWCGVPHDQVGKYIQESTMLQRGIYKHPKIQCLEVKCRAIHNAIDSGILQVSRENGRVSTDHVAPERRHVSRQDLKDWISKEFPSSKPAFLFDELERKTHTAINADSYRALQADRDAARSEIEKLRTLNKKLIDERDALRGENESLKSMVEKSNAPAARSETTYLNIIGGLLYLMLSKSPGGQAQSVYENQASIISALLACFPSKPGIAHRTLEQKFADAKQSLRST